MTLSSRWMMITALPIPHHNRTLIRSAGWEPDMKVRKGLRARKTSCSRVKKNTVGLLDHHVKV